MKGGHMTGASFVFYVTPRKSFLPSRSLISDHFNTIPFAHLSLVHWTLPQQKRLYTLSHFISVKAGTDVRILVRKRSWPAVLLHEL